MTPSELLKDIILSAFPLKRYLYNKDGNIFCGLQALPKLMFFLRDDKRCKLSLIDMFATEEEKNFEICYSLKNYNTNSGVIIRCEGRDTFPSISGIFPNAVNLECEIFDMQGIFFDDNDYLHHIFTDIRHIGGNPLKKSFPLKGFITSFYNEKTMSIDIEEIKNDN